MFCSICGEIQYDKIIHFENLVNEEKFLGMLNVKLFNSFYISLWMFS